MRSKVYQINEGKREFEPNPIKLFWSKKVLSFEIIFNHTNLYELPVENYGQWNKALGMSDFNTHHLRHSLRLGWRGDMGKHIECCLYTRVNGKWHAEILKNKFMPNVKYRGFLEISDRNYLLFMSGGGYDGSAKSERALKRNWGLNYYLGSWFGGKFTSPQYMDYSMSFR